MKKLLFLQPDCCSFACTPLPPPKEYKFELSETEKKPYHLGGYGEFRPVLNGLDRNAALYKLKFYNRDEGKTTGEYNFKPPSWMGVMKTTMPEFFGGSDDDLRQYLLGWSR